MVHDWRTEEALAQIRARDLNERRRASNPSLDRTGVDRYLCECGDRACREQVELSRDEYEAVRSESTWFAIAPNHENPEIDHVVTPHERFSTAKKITQEFANLARAHLPNGR